MLIKLWTSLYIEADGVPFCERNQNVETKDKRMENLKQITYYLIQLFYKTGKKYSCTQTKLGKLLSILAFSYARNGEILFEEKIYEYPQGCGTLIKDLTFIPQSIYLRDLKEEDPDGRHPISEELDETAIIPTPYVSKVTYKLEKNIEDVFKRFGAYSGSQLAECLNPIVKLIKNGNSDELDLSKIEGLDRNVFKDEINEVIDYILYIIPRS